MFRAKTFERKLKINAICLKYLVFFIYKNIYVSPLFVLLIVHTDVTKKHINTREHFKLI